MKVPINKNDLKHFKGDLEKTANEFQRLLYVLAALAVASQFTYDVVLGIKALLIFCVSIWVARETEIFYITQKSDVMRAKAKEALQTTHPEVTGILFALLLPVGTPLFVVAVGSFISIFIGKMVFGGYTFNIFNPAIVGRLFVGIAWPALVTINFPETVDNYILQLIFQKDLSTPVLSPLMELHANGIISLEGMKSLTDLLFKPQHGMLMALPGIVYILLAVIFIIRKSVDLRPLLYTLLSSAVILLLITCSFNLSFNYPLFHVIAGGLLFVTLLMMTDPFTKPYSTLGIIYYSAIFTVVYTLIRFLGKDPDGVIYALLFANLFVPLLNKKTTDISLGLNRKCIVGVISVVLALAATGLFINAIIDQRIESKKIVVNEYVKN